MSCGPTYDRIVSDLRMIAGVKLVADGIKNLARLDAPSNGLVEVTVRAGTESVVVSDEGGALGEALSAGIPERETLTKFSAIKLISKD